MTEEIELDDSQARAVQLMLNAPLATITGGPGTGKTTITREVLARLPPGSNVELAAPTGKAAQRLAEATGHEARTLHRLLGYRPGVGFTVERLVTDLVIVDEASMIDIELFAALVTACQAPTRLMLIGDADQLPPVGPGQPFADLVGAPDLVPCARLDTLHRAAASSWISRNAPRVLTGGPLELVRCSDFEWIPVRSRDDVIKTVVSRVKERPHMQVLIPQKIGTCGSEAGNRALQSVYLDHALTPDEPRIERPAYAIRVGDRVMVTSNIYDLAVFNGDVGTVTAIEPSTELKPLTVIVDMTDVISGGGREVAFEGEQVMKLMLAYALTVHKAQGSQFDGVIVVLHSSQTRMLNRRLAYTALTRTRGDVVIVGDERGLELALSTGFDAKRNTTLIERLRGTLDEVIEP